MSLISMHGAWLSFSDSPLLDNAELHIEDNERVCLVGRNGAGKSTLMKILNREQGLDDGRIVYEQDLIVSRLQQDPPRNVTGSVYDFVAEGISEQAEYLKRYHEISHLVMTDPRDKNLNELAKVQEMLDHHGLWQLENRINEVLAQLGLEADMELSALSGGWLRKAALGRALVSGPKVLLLDEPTNHLDMDSREVLEDALENFPGTILAISHDRYFLDRTVTRIIEIQDGKAEFYSGNYSFYAIEKERRYQERMKQYLKEQAKIQQLEKAAEQMHLWAFMGNDALHKRAFSMEKRIERMRTTQKPTKARRLEARFQSREFKGDEVLQIKGISKAFGERKLFEDVYLRVEGGERIALLGENGTGKTTLLNMLVGLDSPDAGMIRLGPSVKAAYLPQVIHFAHPERSILDTMLYELDITPQSARNRLAAYQFTGEDVFKSVSVLSGGELSRLRLCMLMDESINLLILDEPTNHLDIDSREWLEQAVEEFDGTLLFVSHDRYFINRFATCVWELEEQRITDYPMGFARYRKIKAEQPAKKAEPEKTVKEKSLTEKPQRGNKNQQAARRQLTICEREIAQQEEALAALDARLEEAASDYEKYSALYAEKEAQEQKLTELMERWEALAAEAGE